MKLRNILGLLFATAALTACDAKKDDSAASAVDGAANMAPPVTESIPTEPTMPPDVEIAPPGFSPENSTPPPGSETMPTGNSTPLSSGVMPRKDPTPPPGSEEILKKAPTPPPGSETMPKGMPTPPPGSETMPSSALDKAGDIVKEGATEALEAGKEHLKDVLTN